MADIQALADALTVTEERTAQIALDRKRCVFKHSLVLHRDSASARDVKAMIAHLEAAGMPPTATLKVDGDNNHTRVWAAWSEEANDEALDA